MDARRNKTGLDEVHGSLVKMDPLMQQYLEVCPANALPDHKLLLASLDIQMFLTSIQRWEMAFQEFCAGCFGIRMIH